MTTTAKPNCDSMVRAVREEPWLIPQDDIFVGKDILELLSSSMYVDPMTIYREYVQNAADAIDDAKRNGVLKENNAGKVHVHVDQISRTIRIRDNGKGLPWKQFAPQLMALGGSAKRGSALRGFRGVGRLSGLGYCQELIFRTRVEGETLVSELRWDCKELKRHLRTQNDSVNIYELIKKIVSIRRVKDNASPARFFEVELRGVIRHKDDRLLSPAAIADYLAQVAPVPFAPDFRFRDTLYEALRPHVLLGDLELRVDGQESPVYRPYRDTFEVGENKFDKFSDVSIQQIQGMDGNTAAIAWVLHHGYLGAVPHRALMKGLRVRSGNIQVGDYTLFEELFPEPRFNAWAIGEVHVIDPRIVPNGRRDHFEQGVHFNNLLVQMLPVARDIAKRCRVSSAQRKLTRDVELHALQAREKLDILAQGAISSGIRTKLVKGVERSLRAMERILEKKALDEHPQMKYQRFIVNAHRKLSDRGIKTHQGLPLKKFPRQKRAIYQSIFELIYQCSSNQAVAKNLIDRIIEQL